MDSFIVHCGSFSFDSGRSTDCIYSSYRNCTYIIFYIHRDCVQCTMLKIGFELKLLEKQWMINDIRTASPFNEWWALEKQGAVRLASSLFGIIAHRKGKKRAHRGEERRATSRSNHRDTTRNRKRVKETKQNCDWKLVCAHERGSQEWQAFQQTKILATIQLK